MLIRLYDTLLKGNIPEIDSYKIINFPNSTSHKLGIDYNSCLSILILTKPDKTKFLLSRKLKYFEMLFNKKCKIATEEDLLNGLITEDNYTIITLKPLIRDLQSYFIGICEKVILKLGEEPKASKVAVEINKVISLFQNLSFPPVKTIIGLFGELIIINKSISPEYLLRSWHIKDNAIFDFDDERECLEIKTTTKANRIHLFSQSQLTLNSTKPSFVGSIIISQSDFGISIFQLLDLIKQKVRDENLIYKLDRIMLSTIGNELENLNQITFNYDEGVKSLKFYELKNIPKILTKHIPKEVSSLKYSISLENTKHILNTSSKLLL